MVRVDEDIEKLEPLHIAGEKVKWWLLWKIVCMTVPYKVKHHIRIR